MNIRIDNDDFQKIISLFYDYSEITEVVVFNSSDNNDELNFVVKGKAVKLSIIQNIQIRYEQLNFKYSLSLIIYNKITDNKLKEYINKVGIVIFKR